MHEAQILQATMTDRITVWRQTVSAGAAEERQIYRDRACALSRSAHVASPSSPAAMAPLAERSYRMTLFLPTGTVLLAGDRAQVTRDGQIFCGVTSDSIPYPSHSVCVFEIREVKEA